MNGQLKPNFRSQLAKSIFDDSIEKEVKKGLEKFEKKERNKIAAEILGMVLQMLYDEYGWREKRLNRFLDNFINLSDFVDSGTLNREDFLNNFKIENGKINIIEK